MKRLALPLMASALLAGAALAQIDDATPTDPAATDAIVETDDSGLAPDADGDGIPNSQDEDYVKPGRRHGRGHGPRAFVDENGDGINDLAPDADGDGIPNGQDPDYVKPGRGMGRGFVDADGDGINDLAADTDGDGIPNGRDSDYVKPERGMGRGFIDADGDGVCDRAASGTTQSGTSSKAGSRGKSTPKRGGR